MSEISLNQAVRTAVLASNAKYDEDDVLERLRARKDRGAAGAGGEGGGGDAGVFRGGAGGSQGPGMSRCSAGGCVCGGGRGGGARAWVALPTCLYVCLETWQGRHVVWPPPLPATSSCPQACPPPAHLTLARPSSYAHPPCPTPTHPLPTHPLPLMPTRCPSTSPPHLPPPHTHTLQVVRVVGTCSAWCTTSPAPWPWCSPRMPWRDTCACSSCSGGSSAWRPHWGAAGRCSSVK